MSRWFRSVLEPLYKEAVGELAEFVGAQPDNIVIIMMMMMNIIIMMFMILMRFRVMKSDGYDEHSKTADIINAENDE